MLAVRLRWLVAGLLVAGVLGAVLWFRAARDHAALLAAREKAVAEAALETGALRAEIAKLRAAGIADRPLRESVAKIEAAGGSVSRHGILRSGAGVVTVPCPSPQGQPGGPEESSLPAPAGTAPAPGVAVTIGPAEWELAETRSPEGKRWVSLSDLKVKVTPPGEWVSLPADQGGSKWEVAPEPAQRPRTLWTVAGGLAGSGSGAGYRLGAGVCPAWAAFDGRLAEGRACFEGDILRAGNTAGLVGARLVFGAGRR